MMQATEITTRDDLAALRPEWEALASSASEAGPFLSWPWAQAWLRQAPDAAPRALAARDGAGELRALIPLVERAGELRFMAADRSMYLGVLARSGDLPQAAQAFAAWLRHGRGWRRAVLSSLPVEQLRPLQMAFAAAGLAHRVECDRPSYVMPLPESASAFIAQMSKSFRKRLDYYARRLERECRVGYGVCSPRENPHALEEFFRLHALRTHDAGRRSRLEEAEFAGFARQALTAMDGAASVSLLHCDDRAAAALAGICWGDTFYFWNGGFDPAFARYNVGDVVQRLTIETAIAAGLRQFDFLWGSEDYKLRWGARRRDTYRLEIDRSTVRLVARAAARAVARSTRGAAAAAARKLGRAAQRAPAPRRKQW